MRNISFAADRKSIENGIEKMPGSNIPIISENDSRAQNPDIYLVCPWHFKREIYQKREENFLLKGGQINFSFTKNTNFF